MLVCSVFGSHMFITVSDTTICAKKTGIIFCFGFWVIHIGVVYTLVNEHQHLFFSQTHKNQNLLKICKINYKKKTIVIH